MRVLSPSFMDALQHGFLAPLRQQVIDDKDLDLQIRENYLNVYYKGNSVLRLVEARDGRFVVDIHEKFASGLGLSDLIDGETTQAFISNLPKLKENVIRHGDASLELEYEQLIIRANNLEPRNAGEYFVVNRQYALGSERLDLLGIYWDRRNRRAGQEVPLCIMEVKFALNPDIQDLHDQLARYYAAIQPPAADLAQEQETILRQKLELGLLQGTPERLQAMKTLRIAREIDRFQFIVILVNYNPHSKLLDLERLKELPFTRQIRIFQTGFAMWNKELMVVV